MDARPPINGGRAFICLWFLFPNLAQTRYRSRRAQAGDADGRGHAGAAHTFRQRTALGQARDEIAGEGVACGGGVHGLGAEGPLAALYRLDKKETGYEAVKVIDKVGLSNGLAWNADRTKMYFVDTDFGTVAEYAYDPQTGEIGDGRVIINVPSEMGFPDGMSIDENGKLWVALWNGGAISQWDPETGELLQKIDLPVKNVSSCCFGGPDMDILFITTASQDTDTAQYPLAGNVFCMKPGVKGEKSYRAAI